MFTLHHYIEQPQSVRKHLLTRDCTLDSLLTALLTSEELLAVEIERFIFESFSEFNTFISEIHSYEQQLQRYLSVYAKKTGDMTLPQTKRISVEGYFVNSTDYGAARERQPLVTFYLKAVPCTNKDAAKNLYRWEEELHELRNGVDPHELSTTYDNGFDMPF